MNLSGPNLVPVGSEVPLLKAHLPLRRCEDCADRTLASALRRHSAPAAAGGSATTRSSVSSSSSSSPATVMDVSRDVAFVKLDTIISSSEVVAVRGRTTDDLFLGPVRRLRRRGTPGPSEEHREWQQCFFSPEHNTWKRTGFQECF